jgi:hypothetical protein
MFLLEERRIIPVALCSASAWRMSTKVGGILELILNRRKLPVQTRTSRLYELRWGGATSSISKEMEGVKFGGVTALAQI